MQQQLHAASLGLTAGSFYCSCWLLLLLLLLQPNQLFFQGFYTEKRSWKEGKERLIMIFLSLDFKALW
jgi:hypothetical protein